MKLLALRALYSIGLIYTSTKPPRSAIRNVQQIVTQQKLH